MAASQRRRKYSRVATGPLFFKTDRHENLAVPGGEHAQAGFVVFRQAIRIENMAAVLRPQALQGPNGQRRYPRRWTAETSKRLAHGNVFELELGKLVEYIPCVHSPSPVARGSTGTCTI